MLLTIVWLVAFAATGYAQTRLQNGSENNPTVPQQDQTFDFENTLTGWSKTGTAFDLQPVNAANVRTDQVEAGKLGGDYWRNLSYPLGQHGDHLILTNNAGTGSLTSPQFVLSNSKHFFSFLIGGSSNLLRERLELQILSNSEGDAAQLQRALQDWNAQRNANREAARIETRDGEYVVAVIATAEDGAEHQDLDILQQKIFELPDSLLGRSARIKIIDDSESAHLEVDFIRFTADRPGPYRAPVWGYADYHTHPMAHLAFGAAQNINLLWGSPGGAYDKYKNNSDLIAEDIPHCVKGHNGGPTAEVFINNSEKRAHLGSTVQTLWDYITGRLTKHGRSGGPEFRDFPSFLSGAHQQMHITQIRRNYDGGLRLLVAIATHNRGAEYLASRLNAQKSIDPPTEDCKVVEAVVCGMRELARLNSDWMEIAYSPDEARRIIRHNKLAVVLGIEVDELGKFDGSGTGTAKDEVKALWELGIRAVIPIHGVDNRLGGAALNFEVYSWLNDFLHRQKMNLTVKELDAVTAEFFKLREAGCKSRNVDPREECVPFRFDETQHRVVIKNMPPLGTGPFPQPTPEPTYKGFDGEKNAKGLEQPYGFEYIDELMNRGMILDTSHMSDLSVHDVYKEIGVKLERQHPECAGFSFYNTVSQPCLQFAYPAIVSHAHFRSQARQTGSDFLASEYFISDRNLEAVRRVGGVIGPFVTEDPLIQRGPAPFFNDCAMSSKGFGLNFLYALHRMGGKDVGMATDFIFIPGVAPRFGPNACWAYHLATNPEHELTANSLQYDPGAQLDGVVYAGVPRDKRVRYGNNRPLEPYRMGQRERPFDFNIDGLAHFGLVPDMLQDLKNVGMSGSDFEALFSSSESYLQMWEKVWRISGCSSSSTRCQPDLVALNCDKICNGSCLAPPRGSRRRSPGK